MAFSKITSTDLVDKGVTGLSDVPGLSATDMQKKFDELPKEVIIPKFNKLIDDIESEDGAGNVGMHVPEGYESEKNVEAVMHAVAERAKETAKVKHSHENKNVLDLITDIVKTGYDRLVTLFKDITSISDTVSDSSSTLPTGKAIVAYVKRMGGGDMATSVYDTNNSGVVDDAEKLGGELPSVYQKTTSQNLQTQSKEIVGAINEVFNMAPETVDPKNATVAGLAADALATKNAFAEQNVKLQNVEQSFEAGCNTIVSGITAYGITPKSNSPADIVTAIGDVKRSAEPKLIYVTANKVDNSTVTLDFSHVEGYKNLTANDILVCIYPGNGYASNAGTYTSKQTYTYDSSTGIMTITSDEIATGYIGVGYGIVVPAMIKPDYTGTATFVSCGSLTCNFDLTGVRDYRKLTKENIILQFSNVIRYSSKNGNGAGYYMGQTYDATTGILSYRAHSTGLERTNASALGTVTVGVKL